MAKIIDKMHLVLFIRCQWFRDLIFFDGGISGL